MKLKQIIISTAILLSIFSSVYFSNANTSAPDTDVLNLQKAIIELKKRVDANNARISDLNERIRVLEENLKGNGNGNE